MLVGACSVLMFRLISIGVDHVRKEILLNEINTRDTLTGLYNQNYFKQFVQVNSETGPIGVIFFDVNGLKKINDEYGHERGDLLLKRCADSIRAICDESSSIAFRVGGDEFLLLIEGATEPVIIQKLAEWKTALETINHQNAIEYDGLDCSMAAGYALGQYEDLGSLISRADSLMYKNKAIMKGKSKLFGE